MANLPASGEGGAKGGGEVVEGSAWASLEKELPPRQMAAHPDLSIYH